MELKEYLRTIADFPRPGIQFYDIAPLLAHGGAYRHAVELMAQHAKKLQAGMIAGLEARGFLFGPAIAAELGLGFVMLRKSGKLPGLTQHISYSLEYGSDTLQIQADIIIPGTRVVVVDDVLATGGTLAAGINLLRQVGAHVTGAVTLLELDALAGRRKLDVPVHSLLHY